MAHSCYKEMSKEEFLIITSLQVGLQQLVFKLPERAHDASDALIDSTWADLALMNLNLAQLKGYHTVPHNIMVNLGCALMTKCGVKATRANVPEILEAEQRGPDGKREDVVTVGGGTGFRAPPIGRQPNGDL